MNQAAIPVVPLRTVDIFSLENDRRFVANALPLFGSSLGTESLACGRCGGIIARTVDTATLYGNLQGAQRVIVTCTCGAHNVLVEERRAVPR